MAESKALWFSRHAPTPEQVAEISELGFELVGMADGMRLGGIDILSWGEADAVYEGIRKLLRDNAATAVFGVYPAPIQSYISDNTLGNSAIPCFEAWNGKRSVEGGVATFKHITFVRVGGIYP